MNFACFVDWCYVWVKEQAEYFHINQQFFYREMTDTIQYKIPSKF